MRHLLSVIFLVIASAAFAADNDGNSASTSGGPTLSELLLQPNFLTSYKAMLGTEQVPDWVAAFAKTLQGPPVPSLDLLAGGKIYVLGVTCKPNECADHELFVLFQGDGAQAWGLLMEGDKRTWLGNPDQTLQDAILSRVQ